MKDGVVPCPGFGLAMEAAHETKVASRHQYCLSAQMLLVDRYYRLVGPAAWLRDRRRDGGICELSENE
jgi:hypothetical protein